MSGQHLIEKVMRPLRWIVGTTALNALLLVIMAQILDGFDIRSFEGLITLALLLAVLPALLSQFIYLAARLTHPIIFPIIAFGMTGLLTLISDDILEWVGIEGVQINGFWTALWISLGITFFGTLLAAIFSWTDEDAYDIYVTRVLKESYGIRHLETAKPALLFVEFDGLSRDVLNRAVSEGYMPTVKRWLDEGSHELVGWEPDLSSQTSASQAGILLGDNTGIPAFRWWDKARGHLMVSSSMSAASELETALSTGMGLLVHDGGSRFNVFSGDAPDFMATFSKVGRSSLGANASYLAYFTNPYVVPRVLGLYVADCVREVWQGFRQRRRKEVPRGHRRFKYVLVRAATTTVMLEAGRFVATADICQGLPSAYYTFFSYDEVAHHSNIQSTDGLKVLRKMDEMLAGLERASDDAPRPVRFVLLSDHGQSQGSTFKQRYGKTLEEVVTELLAPDKQVKAILESAEGLGNISMALTEAVGADTRAANLGERVLRGQMSNGKVDLGDYRERDQQVEGSIHQGADVVVLASGNLGLISFPQFTRRLTLEEMSREFPGLVAGLVGHPGISFLLVNSDTDGGVVLGKDGIYFLDDDRYTGTDPLDPFGPNAARHLKRANGFPNAPDIYVNSIFDTVTEEVAAFEELVGCHGGLGGPQQRPFILYPAGFDTGSEPIIGAGAVCALFKRWIDQLQGPFDAPEPASTEAQRTPA